MFQPLDPYIDFYLFQMPPSFAYNDENIERISVFAKGSGSALGWPLSFVTRVGSIVRMPLTN